MNLVTFFASGTLVTLAIWFVQRRSWQLWIRVVCLLVTLAALLLFLYFQAGFSTLTLGGEEKWHNTSPYVEILFFLFMLAGMGARYITKAIEVRREKIAELKRQGGTFANPKIEFDLWEFSYPLFISIITYGILASQIKDHSFSIANATLSFQTGFFWQTLLAKQQGG
jgi:hypothetical protein